MKEEKKNDVAVLLDYAGSRRGLTFLGLALSALSMLFSMAPYICIWLTARNLIAAAPEWTQAQNISKYGWIAFAFAVGGIILYFAGLMCTHLAAFRTALCNTQMKLNLFVLKEFVPALHKLVLVLLISHALLPALSLL